MRTAEQVTADVKHFERMHFINDMTFMLVSMALIAMMIFSLYVLMNETLCERITQGVYDAQTQAAMKLDANTCALPWYERL